VIPSPLLASRFLSSWDQVSNNTPSNIVAGIFDNIFDGIQRPLEVIADMSKSVFIPRGIEVPKLDQTKDWHFVVNKGL
jgi:vacuolar-type H+-ATPase catalytic subunit A/Vma1